ncbi:uncharacterized protein LOC104266612 isoform X1 [Ciona intestinalis]
MSLFSAVVDRIEMATLQNGSSPVVKKRGRPPKIKPESGATPSKQTKITDNMKKTKRTVDRFKGVTKEELMTRLLPDRIKHGLDILIIGINPGLFAAYKGHHYAGPGNHFWKCINLSGMVGKPVTSDNDVELMEYGIGFSTIVQRTTPSAKDLTSKEIREGGKELIEKIKIYQPKIAVFNGKGIYEIFSKEMFGKKKKDFLFGRQAELIPGTNTHIFVMPSSSARCAQFPRAQDKVHYYIQIKRLRDEINGVRLNTDVVETTYTFDLKKATEMAKVQKVKEERYDPSYDNNEISFPQTCPPVAQYNGAGCSKDEHPTNTGDQPPPTTTTASNHPHLVKFLCQKEPEKALKEPPTPAKLSIPQLRETVSEEQKNERVGIWVKTQLEQDYDSEPPMGYEEIARSEGNEPTESDRASQQSLVSAGVSGSISTGSTSGYGSADTTTNHARQDRVEMWVREQQYVRQQQPPLVARSQPARSDEPWINGGSRHLASPHPISSSDSPNDSFRPPVPLYSTWGEGIPRFAELTQNSNNNNIYQPQASFNSISP